MALAQVLHAQQTAGCKRLIAPMWRHGSYGDVSASVLMPLKRNCA